MKRLLTSERFLILTSFGIIYIVWGSTYLANWLAIQDIPPFLMAGSRFFIAGLILYALSTLFGGQKTTLKQWKGAALSGFLFLSVGTGGIVWAEQWVSSGIAAIIVSFEPLLVVLLLWQMQNKRPSYRTLAGTSLGIIGMAFLVGQDEFISNKETLTGVLVILTSITAWAYATIKITDLAMPKSKLQGAGMQMICGGGALLLISALSGDMAGFHLANLTQESFLAWLYLLVFGSIIAFSAFNFLLVKSTPDKVATAGYVNPVVALLLGWGLNNEEVTTQSLLATALLLGGVIFINTNKNFLKRRKRTPRPLPLAGLAAGLGEGTTEVDIRPAEKNNDIVARIWKGQTPFDKADDYVEWTKKTVVPEFRNLPGNLGLTLHRRNEDGVSHMTFVSYWKNMDAVKNFAGKNFKKARLYPIEREMLIGKSDKVKHQNVRT